LICNLSAVASLVKTKTMSRLLLLTTLLFSFACTQVKKSQTTTRSNTLPALKVLDDTTTLELKISSLSIDVKVTGQIATTTFDIVFYNSLDRVLEGEFEFPLSDGQNISRYALEVNGKLREGVVAEKKEARIAFENTVRQNIDPGLVEKTKGNNFRTRIYPIPSKGTKHVLIAIEQELDYRNGQFVYQLPIYAKELIDNFKLEAAVLKTSGEPGLRDNELEGFSFKAVDKGYTGLFIKRSFKPSHLFAFSIPHKESSRPMVFFEKYNGKDYFYTTSVLTVEQQNKTTPKTLGILWDISSSAQKRNIEKETEFLKKYVSSFNNIQVLLVPFHINTLQTKKFDINNGDVSQLLNELKNFEWDGGTQLGAINLNQYIVEEFLLFSDGISTFGAKEIMLATKPVYSINSSSSADYSYLKFIAQQTGGKFIDLNKVDVSQGAGEIEQRSLHIINALVTEGQADDLVIKCNEMNDIVSIAGVLKTQAAKIKVQIGYEKNKVLFEKDIFIERINGNSDGNIKRIWATMKVDELDLLYEKNKAEITSLGKQFSIVTRNTSLLVLDRVEDYVEHEITPPDELKEEYYSLLKEKQKEKEDKEHTAFKEAIEAMEGLKAWYNKKFDGKPKSNTQITGVDSITISTDLSSNTYIATDSTAVMRYSISAPPENQEGLRQDFASGVSEMKLEEVVVSNLRQPYESEIHLSEWKPDAPYLKELKSVSQNGQLKKYYELKKKNASQPSFFVDVAKYFYESNRKEMALIVLSNIAELKLEDAELLRIMAFQLMEANELQLAILTFEEILKLREEEPHSYRDLALAYNEAGKHDEALQLLYKLILGNWDDRFADVKAIALNEMNAIISANPSLSVSAIDKRFIYAMPVDVRIVVGWSSDNSDIDLWITDPLLEKCTYQNNETSIGGKLSQDVTQGYGPEEFCLKKARNGEYTIEANLFGDSRQTLGGPITIKADLFTDYGRPKQKRRTINFRVTTNKEVVKVGSLKFSN
jgi:tetratricopeptide (TPR) repeat protein